MKRITLSGSLMVLLLIFGSWGRTGHSTIGLIAAKHLTPKATAAVTALLNGQSLADVASWADDHRSPTTAPWHFINVELGLSFDDFSKQVERMEDVYTVLQKQEAIIADNNASPDDRAKALKFIVHFVGDMHQPMHVSRAEDKGGNTIQVRYDGQGTNLHSLWDTKLLEHAGLSTGQLVVEFDKATPAQIKKWQSDPQIVWAWESYQISSQLYGEIEKNETVIDEAYYNAHIPIVENRMEKAGIRLAGLLNRILDGATVPPATTSTKTINVTDAASHYGEQVTVTAKVFGTRDFGSMVLVNLGAAYPNSPLTIVLRGDAKSLGSGVEGKTITVTGKVEQYKDKPEIVVTDKGQVTW
jgi:hypothetical protein